MQRPLRTVANESNFVFERKKKQPSNLHNSRNLSQNDSVPLPTKSPLKIITRYTLTRLMHWRTIDWGLRNALINKIAHRLKFNHFCVCICFCCFQPRQVCNDFLFNLIFFPHEWHFHPKYTAKFDIRSGKWAKLSSSPRFFLLHFVLFFVIRYFCAVIGLNANFAISLFVLLSIFSPVQYIVIRIRI